MMNTCIEQSNQMDSVVLSTGRVFDYFERTPSAGIIIGSALMAGGLSAVIIYGIKLFNT